MKVAIPALDRELDENPSKIWSMAYALFWQEMPNRQEAAAPWYDFLDDLVPAESPDPDGVPISVDGVKYLLELVSHFAYHHSKLPAAKLVRPLRQLYEQNDRYADYTLAEDPTLDRHRDWRCSVVEIIEEIKGIINSALT